jgi:hypothetical protein
MQSGSSGVHNPPSDADLKRWKVSNCSGIVALAKQAEHSKTSPTMNLKKRLLYRYQSVAECCSEGIQDPALLSREPLSVPFADFHYAKAETHEIRFE